MADTDVLEGIMDPVENSDPPIEEETPPNPETPPGEEVSSEEVSPNEDLSGEEVPPELSLEERFAELEKANNGLKEAVTAERRKRQEMQQKVTQVSDFLSAAEQKRVQEQQAALPSEPEDPGIPLSFDENEEPILPADKLEEIVKKTIQKEISPIQQEISRTKQEQQVKAIQNDIQTTVESVVSTKPEYKAAFDQLNGQWAWLSKRVDDYVAETGVTPASKEDALNMIFSSGIEEEFQKQYPSMDMEALLDAYMTPVTAKAVMKRKLKKALDLAATTSQGGDKSSLSQLKKLAEKPGFSKAPNRGRKPSLTDIADIPMDTFLALSEAEVERLRDMME